MKIVREILWMVFVMSAFALGYFIVALLTVGFYWIFGMGAPCVIAGMGSFLFYYERLQVRKFQGNAQEIDKIIPAVLFVSTIILIPLSLWLRQLPQS
ncbi:hypothetical protein [Parasutterella excrementihominis]|jgi:hypothetical protein|uniref:hypothetical protein n=1 Tax=Parasutterella excrementihominis TaxID=487175 RepID=UPI0027BA5768|nr:hypothetical protein [Parasutterella excrementihominis]